MNETLVTRGAIDLLLQPASMVVLRLGRLLRKRRRVLDVAACAAGEVRWAMGIMALRAVHRFRTGEGVGCRHRSGFEDFRVTRCAFRCLVLRHHHRVFGFVYDMTAGAGQFLGVCAFAPMGLFALVMTRQAGLISLRDGCLAVFREDDVADLHREFHVFGARAMTAFTLLA